jgi:hypothetical protein
VANIFRNSFANRISNRGLVRLSASRSPSDRCRQDVLRCRRNWRCRWGGQKGTKALAGFLRPPERKKLLTVPGINVQANSKAWLVTYDPANTELDDWVVFREVSSDENADALGSLAAVSKHRDCATMNHPPSTAFQFHLMPAAYRYLYVRPRDQPETSMGVSGQRSTAQVDMMVMLPGRCCWCWATFGGGAQLQSRVVLNRPRPRS